MQHVYDTEEGSIAVRLKDSETFDDIWTVGRNFSLAFLARGGTTRIEGS